ncbi:MAG: zf-HC2 domain-containing protein [Nocardioidaceae bacterium]|nr:zf-HC2 domain-containing protein [Nocardioidaceae bacterium]
MIASLRRMVTCHWSARRIERYLDNDPSAPLTLSEVRRLEEHLAVCEKCAHVGADQRALSRALSLWSQRRLVDEAALARMHDALNRVIAEGDR